MKKHILNNPEKHETLHAGAVQIEKALKEYYPETDPLVLKKLEDWQDLKFGLLMHWAPSSQWGIVESWSLCSEDEPWCRRKIENYTEYRRQYEGLKDTFNPIRFNPGKWADAASDAGMRYVVFTTKHHDGFCMYDSHFTDYKITDKGCPFHTNPRANIAKEVFDVFRNKDFMTGVYYSKPDWHSDYFWWERFATPDRNANYDIQKYPDRWKKFVEFTQNQIDELMTGFGRIDILWLDGCWVRSYTAEELNAERKNAGFNLYRTQNQDIDMASITKRSRLKQPGLIVVDRAVPGPYQNYLTPENQVPEKTLPYPWETCMPITPSWSYEPGLEYKPARNLVHLLVDIVAKGGNFLLNIAPTPDGDFEDDAYDRLARIGAWMDKNGEAIYSSRPIEPFAEENFRFTRGRDGFVYAIYLVDEQEATPPRTARISNFCPVPDTRIEVLGTKHAVRWVKDGAGCTLEFSDEVRSAISGEFAWTLKLKV